jgi:hypothetical protein
VNIILETEVTSERGWLQKAMKSAGAKTIEEHIDNSSYPGAWASRTSATIS